MAMRRPRIKAAANILSAKRKPKATAGEAKTSAENGPAPAKPPEAQPTDKEVEEEHVDEKASVGGEVTAASMTPKSEADATICSSEISPQDKQCNGIEAEEKAKGNSEQAICEEVNATSVEAKDDKSALSSNQQQIESSSERIETPSEQMETPSSSAESQPAKATRRPRIRATANVAALTKKRSQPGLGPSPTDNIKAEKNVPETDAKKSDVPETDAKKSDLPDKPRDSCESDEAQKTVEAPKSEVEMGVKSSEEPNSSSSSKEAAQTKPPTTTRRPRLKAAANVMAAKRRSKPGLSTTAPNDTSAREDERRETEVAPMKEEVKNETTLVSPKKEEHNSSSDEFINYKDEEGDDKQPPGSVLKGVPSAKPLIDDSSSFKCPSSVEYAALHGNQPAAGPSNLADEAATTEYEDILQADLQKSLLGPPMSPSSPSKAVSRQRIRVTPIFGQRRNSFVGSSPHNADDGNVSDSHPSSSPYQHHRRERHYSGAHTPFSTMASPALSLGGGSTGHYGSPHKYAPLIPSGRIRTESSCSTFSDFVGGSQKPRKVDDNLARRRDFEARFTNGVPDKASIKMSDLIYYNPVTNPMEAKPRNQIKAESKPPVEEYPKQELKEEAPDYDNAMPVPQLKLNADGELIIDDKSLEIETTAEQEARKILAKASLIYLDENTGMNGFYKRHKRTKDWAPDETIKFYRCLQILGTDFSLMCQLFPNRTRRDLKLKFKKEERCNAALINKALMHPKEFNIDELTKQFEEEDNAREEAEKKWKEIKAANPKCVNKVKQKQAHISAASRILSRGHDIYENENIIKKKLGKRALSAAQKKAKKPLGESEELPELIAETNKRQTRKRRLKDDATLAACNEAAPPKQISLDVEIDDDEISRGLNELLETPIIEYSDYHETPRHQLNLETSANKSPHLNAIAEESKQPAAKTISTLVATTTSPLPSTRTTTTSELPPPLDLVSVEYPSASTQLNNVSFSVQTSPLSLLYSETPLQAAAGSSVLDNSYSLVCPVIPSTDVRSNQWQLAGPDAAPPKPPADINQDSIAPINTESPYIPTTVTSSVERPASPMDVEIISSLEPDFGESHADMHSPCSSISPIPMDDDSSQEASLDRTKQPKDAIATIIEEVPATSEEDVPGTEDEEIPGTEDDEIPGTEDDEIPETEEEEVPGTEDEEVPGTEEEEVPETPEYPPKISEDPFKSMTHPASVSKKDISDFSIPLEKQVTLILSEGKASTAERPKTIASVVARSNVTLNTPPVPETTQSQKPLCSPRMSEVIQLGPPETSPSKSPGRYMNTFTEEELMPSTSRSAKMIQQRARQEELRQQEELRYQELRQHELREQDLRHQEGLRRQEELRRQNESRQQEDRRQREIQQQKEIKQEQQLEEQSQQLESPTPKDDADIYQILTEIVKGTLVLVSTLKPNSDEMVHEVFVQDLETEELVGEALPLPQHQIDRIVQMMGDDEDEEEGQD